MALFCVAIRKDSISLLRFPFLSHVQVFSCEISLICRFLCEFFTRALAYELSLESEGQQVPSGPLDSPQYSGRSQQCVRLDSLDSSFDFLLFQFPFQNFGNRSKCTNYNWYYGHVPQFCFWLFFFFFLVFWQCLSFRFLLFSLCG